MLGRCLLKDLADAFVAEPAKEFPMGKFLAGEVMDIAFDSRKDRSLVHLSLRPSAVLSGCEVFLHGGGSGGAGVASSNQ